MRRYWDAWDVEIYHLETRKELKFGNISVVASGRFRASVSAEIQYGQSSVKVKVW